MDLPDPLTVDCHVHLLPDRLARAVRDFFERAIPGRIIHPIDPHAVLDMLVTEGVSEVWNLPYVHRPGMADELNGAMAAMSDDRIDVVAGCTVHPADDSPGAIVRRAHERHGARFVKLHCSVADHQPDDARLDEVYDAAAELGMPVVIHVGHGIDGRTTTEEVDRLSPAASRHPATTFVVAHMGHPATAAAARLMDTHPNVWADLTPVLADPVALPRDVERFADRLLFGSDTPNTGRTIEDLLGDLAGLPEEIRAAVTGGNARRLLGQRP